MRFPVDVKRHSQSASWTYDDLDRYQNSIRESILNGGESRIVISEVSPVITLGKNARLNSLTARPEDYAVRGISVFRTDRGGDATYHGPGQLCFFPVMKLEEWAGDPRGVRKAVEKLLGLAFEVASSFGVSAEIRMGSQVGVWTPDGKLASVGIRVRDGVILHGLSLNIFRTPESFYGLKPCGLDCQTAFLGDSVPFEKVCERVLNAVL